MAFPFSDEELKQMAAKYGARDAKDSEGVDGLDADTLSDIGDDAWYHSGWMEFENHPDLEGYESEMGDKATELRLSQIYIAAFVDALT